MMETLLGRDVAGMRTANPLDIITAIYSEFQLLSFLMFVPKWYICYFQKLQRNQISFLSSPCLPRRVLVQIL